MAIGDTKTQYGTSTAITITATTLAQAAARESTAVDNGTNKFLDAIVYMTATIASGTPGADKRIYVYAYGSEDGTNYGSNATGSDAALTMQTPTNLRIIGVVHTATGNTAYKTQPMSVAKAFDGILPRKWGIVVYNQTNLAFTACSAAYTGIFTNEAAS